MSSVGDLMHDPCEPDDRLKRFVADAYRSTPAADAAQARERVDRALAAQPSPRAMFRGGHIASWFAPRLWLVHPAYAAAAVVVVLALGVVLGRALAPRTNDAGAVRPVLPAAHGPAQAVVEFVFVAPNASRVALVGDFNAWDPAATPLVRQGDGSVWSTRVTLSPGRHVYSFVLDGTRWVSDPQAPLEPANEFGFRNSVVVVSEVPPS
jgi:hypothetical protein